VNPTSSATPQQHPGPLPLADAFANILSREQLDHAIAHENIAVRNCTFTPAVTFWTFFTQLFHAGSSCRNALLKLSAARFADRPQNQDPLYTGTYCKARQRLPESLLTHVRRGIADRADAQTRAWRWHDHTVKIPDGTTLSMPDTPANQQAFPQSKNQKRGVGFPLARLVVIISLATGCILRTRLGSHRGTGTGETSLLAQMLCEFQAKDLVVADAGFSHFWLIASLLSRGADYLGHLSSTRQADYSTGRQLGLKDHVLVWNKKDSPKPPGLTKAQWEALPETIEVRRFWVVIERPGFRTQGLPLVTTLLDATKYVRDDLANLYQRRWQVELHLRSLKADFAMGILKCQSPAMVAKEVAMHTLVFNAVRAVMVAAGGVVQRAPYRLSVTAAWEAIESWTEGLRNLTSRAAAWSRLLRVIGSEVVDERPNRVEPRVLKRRPKDCKYMTKPRNNYPRVTKSQP
jgi:putative transposase